MALQVLIAHTGRRLEADPILFTSLEAFKEWVASYEDAVAVSDHVSLTAQGKAVRLQALQTAEICVYDRRIVQAPTWSSAKQLLSAVSISEKYEPSKPPDTIADQTSMESWKALFKERRSWTKDVVEDCAAMLEDARDRFDEIDVIMKCVDAAVINFEKHVKALEQKNIDVQAWATDIQREQSISGKDWEANLSRLQLVPVTSEMMKFMTGRDNPKSQQRATLLDLFAQEAVKKAGKIACDASAQHSRKCQDLATKVDEILSKTSQLYDKIEKSPAQLAISRAPEAGELMADIEALSTKIESDHESVMSYTNTPKDVSQASKIALLHARSFLPNLTQRSVDMYKILRFAAEARNNVAEGSLEIMQGIAALTSLLSTATSHIGSLELNPSSLGAMQLISTLHNMPVIYASFLAEGIRRREWSEKVRSDSLTLANGMAVFQDEEVRRRRKWQKSIGATLWGERVEQKVMGLEVSLYGDNDEWPPSEKQDLEDLLEMISVKEADPGIAREVSKIITELDYPTKQQIKRIKTFKAESIHEAALGRSALLLRGDNDLLHTLQDEKLKIEVKLKTAESRVRRLEDLLHRQSHLGRTTTGNIFQVSTNLDSDLCNNSPSLPFSRADNERSRRSSDSLRRFSANLGPDEKGYQQKLLSTEAELVAEREKASGLQKDIYAWTNANDTMGTQLEELMSTKNDLLENFEAQQREFIEERKSLETEIERLKAKLEDVEDELDRYSGSRENEKTNVDERIRILQDELDSLRRSTKAENQRVQGQVDFLRNDAKSHRETNDNLKKQLQKAGEENEELKARVGSADLFGQDKMQVLRALHTQLLPEEQSPTEPQALRDALFRKTSDIILDVSKLRTEIAMIESDRDDAHGTIDETKKQMAQVKAKLTVEEDESFKLKGSLASEQARFTALETELNEVRDHLSKVRSQFADGQTGSEALRGRLEEEEYKVISLSGDLASSQSRVGSLEEELGLLMDKLSSEQAVHEKLSQRFETRTSRVKDLTQRAYAQNDRLCRLLERLSYSISREGDSMIIQRLPRPERSSTANDSSDPGTVLRRSLSGAARKAPVDSGDIELLYWMYTEDTDAESDKYEAYLNSLGGFDVETFCETITKRIKETEYKAKKYSKDARAYRDKSHTAQKEAHEKIAYKDFKEGDLALFLPTRNQATGAWAAFNVGAPHYFLREQDSHKLRSREWLLARIHKIEDRVVDLSKSIPATQALHDGRSFGDTSNGVDSFEDDNPFDLSDGLRWYLIDASEEKPGAPSTPGLSKTTVASAHIDATGDIRRSKKSSASGVDGLNKTLSKSLDSRRSSNNSKKSVQAQSNLVPKSGLSTQDVAPDEAGTSPNPNFEESAASVTNASKKDQAVDPGDDGQSRDVGTEDKQPPHSEYLPHSKQQLYMNNMSAGTSPSKRSVIWDSLWSLDLSLESGKGKK